MFFWAVAFVGAVLRKAKGFIGSLMLHCLPVPAQPGSCTRAFGSLCFWSPCKQTRAAVSVLPAFAPPSADSCTSPQHGGVNASTCHHLLLLRSREMAFCRGLGGSHAIRFFIY